MIYLLKPLLSSRLWGGKTLSKIFHEKTNEKIGEAWIMSCLDKMNSPIKDSSLTLKDVFKKNKNIVKKGYRDEFPLLIKLIDAQDDLSIQVHPNVKTESWHILSKKPSKLYLGLKKNNAMSFGDSWLDVSMFESTKYSIAVGNAQDCAKEKATIVADTVMNHGVAKILPEILDL